MLNGVKHLAIAREILRGVYPRAQRRAQTCPRAKRRNDIVHHLTCDRALDSRLRDCCQTLFATAKIATACYAGLAMTKKSGFMSLRGAERRSNLYFGNRPIRGNDRVRGNPANPSCRTELPEIGGKSPHQSKKPTY
jgi:hypothetical protein